MKTNNIIILLIATIVSACTSGGVYYSDFKPIDDIGWTKEKAYTFVLPDTITEPKSDLQICIRHDNYYRYRNVRLTVDYVKNGKVAESDTINFTLSDKYGNWNGSGLGKLFQSTATIRQNIRPNEFSEVIVWHNMRCDTVTNITDLGLILTPHQNK